ncbi:MAG: C1 family peptidase [Bacteroidales bacterium]|nr:C1 family peptidase [Bacteroidales bacterium]MCF8404183.1 C1 family peptidase [Bacteroidales bacterium]
MKRFSLLFGIIFYSLMQMIAQEVDETTLNEIRQSFKDTPENRALMNAVSHNDIKKLAENRENEGKLNHYFSDEVKTSGISNQNQSGRCWLYTGLNTLKPMVQEKYNLSDFEFSQTYNFFWDQFEKANLFLEIARETAHLPMNDKKVEWLFQNPIGDGGQWTTFADNVAKYGLVPTSAMPDSYQSEKTSMMSRLLRRKLREQGLEMREISNSRMREDLKAQKKIEMLKEVYRILVLSLGEPPTEFSWQYKDKDDNLSSSNTYTPKTFYQEIIGLNLNDYIMLMDDPRHEYHKLYEVEYDRNLVEGGNWKYINLPASKIKEFAVKSIKANEAMYFSCDVGKQLNTEWGILDVNNYSYDDLFGVDFSLNKKQRIETFESASTHGMALVGVNILPDGQTEKWKLENSWGADKGNKGYLTMTDAWFDEYMFRLVINKKYIDAGTLKILDLKAVLLPPWDPMY